jgi:hypothetical protein
MFGRQRREENGGEWRKGRRTHRGRTETLDIHPILGGKVDYLGLDLGGTRGVRTINSRLPIVSRKRIPRGARAKIKFGQHRKALRAFQLLGFRKRRNFFSGIVDNSENFRNYISASFDDDRFSDVDAKLDDKIFVVEGGSLDLDAVDVDWVENCHRGYFSGTSDLKKK